MILSAPHQTSEMVYPMNVHRRASVYVEGMLYRSLCCFVLISKYVKSGAQSGGFFIPYKPPSYPSKFLLDPCVRHFITYVVITPVPFSAALKHCQRGSKTFSFARHGALATRPTAIDSTTRSVAGLADVPASHDHSAWCWIFACAVRGW